MSRNKLIHILGHNYLVDDFTTITPKIIDNARRRLYLEDWSPIRFVSERIRHFFKNKNPECSGSLYEEFSFDTPVVTINDNFDSLLIPKDHVSRRPADTYYVNKDYLFRSHTSAHQAHCLNQGSKAFIAIADCYRRDEIDRSHFPTFHQCEIFKLFNYNEATSGNLEDMKDPNNMETSTKQASYSQKASSFVELKLKGSIEKFVKDFFDKSDLQMRWVNAYFPFTHPSFELEILWQDKWLEVLGCGIVRDEILKASNVREHIGFAAGFGLERFAMLKYDIPDIRLFWTKDTGFSHQFEGRSPFDNIRFVPFSECPQCINDLSFWLPGDSNNEYSNLHSNDIYDLCRTYGGELIEQVKMIDEFTHPKTKRKSRCYRIVYRSAERVLTKEEVNQIHSIIASKCSQNFNVEIR